MGRDEPSTCLALLLIILCHYVLSRRLNIYGVYDLPAILFYIVAFLMLTSGNERVVVAGASLAVLFSMNRETVIVAHTHAAAFIIFRYWPDRHKLRTFLGPIIIGAAAIVLLRIALAHSLFDAGLFGTVSAEAFEKPRIIYNIERVLVFIPAAPITVVGRKLCRTAHL
jgi:hypothetical protein